MGDRGHMNPETSFDGFDGQDDDAGTIFDPLLPPLVGFITPEIGISDDKARLGRRKAHGSGRGVFVVVCLGLGWRFAGSDQLNVFL